MNGATLFRSNGPSWRFEWDHGCKAYLHRSVRGTVYAVLGISESKPMWIGRLYNGAWCTCERDIGAEYIQFDDGSEFWFKGQLKTKEAG